MDWGMMDNCRLSGTARRGKPPVTPHNDADSRAKAHVQTVARSARGSRWTVCWAVVFTLLLVQFVYFWLFSIAFADDEFAVVATARHKKKVIEGSVRLQAAQVALIGLLESQPRPKREVPGLCVAVVASQRPMQYIEQLLASYVLGGNTMPLKIVQQHGWVLPTKYRRVAQLFEGPRVAGVNHRTLMTANVAEALRLCQPNGTPSCDHWTIVLEDDIEVTDHFVEKFLARVVQPLKGRTDVHHVTLLTSQWWNGWQHNDFQSGIILAGVSIVAVAMVGVFYFCFKDCNTRMHLCFWGLFCFVPFVVVNILCLSKQHALRLFYPFLPWQSVGLVPRCTPKYNGCGAMSQGLAFPQCQVPALSQAFQVPDGSFLEGTDLVLMDHWRGSGLAAFEVVPNLVQHYGAMSNVYPSYGEEDLRISRLYASLKMSSSFVDPVDFFV